MKSCRKNRKLIAWLVMDALDAAQAAELTRHLRGCEDCRRYWEEICVVKQRLTGLECLAAPAIEPSLKARACRPAPINQPRTIARAEPRSRPGVLAWRLTVPALAIVMLALLILSALVRRPVVPRLAPAQSQPLSAAVPAPDVLPTVANYRAIANQSLDELDEVLARQALKPVVTPRSPSAGTLALLDLPE